MTYEKIGVAISTTGQEHRLGFLETCIQRWRNVLPLGSVLVITVDGDDLEVEAAEAACGDSYGAVIKVKGPEHRMGVAANKNTGIEFLMDAGVEHLFLCDDDTWPLSSMALDLHIEMSDDHPHSMVCWGASRLEKIHEDLVVASWTWPRGVLLYTRRHVIEEVGGMDERFGLGGHEHAEWSRRIYKAGFSPWPFVSPRLYGKAGEDGKATRAGLYWNCTDMKSASESPGAWMRRKMRNSTIQFSGVQKEWANHMWVQTEGSTDYVPYSAAANGRNSATMT